MLTRVLSRTITRASIACFIASACLPSASQLVYPPSRAGSEATLSFGITVADPYRWLEDTQNPDVKTWYRSQNALTSEYFASIPTRSAVYSRIEALSAVPTSGPAFFRPGRIFWTETQPNRDQSVLKTKDLHTGVETVIVDPNTWSGGGSYSLSAFSPSPDGRSVTFFLRRSGIQSFYLYCMDVASGKIVELPSPPTQPAMDVVAWLKDSSGFFYTRETPSTTKTSLSGFEYSIYLHKVANDSPQSDQHVLGGGTFSSQSLVPYSSVSGAYLIVRSWKKMGLNRGVILIPMTGDQVDPTRAIFVDPEQTSHNVPMGFKNNQLIMLTSQSAPNYRIVAVNPATPNIENWTTLIQERRTPIDDAAFQEGKILVSYMKDAAATLTLFDEDGKPLNDILLPGVGAISRVWSNRLDGHFLFSFNSPVRPLTIFKLSLEDLSVTPAMPSKQIFDADGFILEHHLVKVRDGTLVPVFVAMARGTKRDGTLPVILNGYGGFGVANGLTFSTREAVWLTMGGGVVVAGIRGGSEYGRQWHDQGRGRNKINAVNDLVDVAQWLVSEKITNPKALGIQGISNGGLIISAAVNQRPDLFGAAVNNVGLTDMVRYETAKNVFNWTDEYGTAANEEDFKSLLSYSPLHQVKKGATYPPILVFAAELDDRVPSWHQYKYIATLQNSDIGQSPKLLSVAMGTGHAYGKPKSILRSEWTDALIFFSKHLGLATYQP